MKKGWLWVISLVYLGTNLTFLHAADLIVDRTDDTAEANAQICDQDETNHNCSLRGAILKANSDPEPDRIILQAQTYTLTLRKVADESDGAFDLDASVGDLDITEPLTIVGQGANQTIITTASSAEVDAFDDRILMINGEEDAIEVTLEGLTLSHGKTTTQGGAIWMAKNGSLRVNQCYFHNNQSGTFGGGALAVTHGEANQVLITNSTFANNRVEQADFRGGGAIFYEGEELIILNSTFSGNQVQLMAGSDPSLVPGGGAINAFQGEVTVIHSTLVGNQCSVYGGAFWVKGTLHLKNSILANNRAQVENFSDPNSGTAQNCFVEAPSLANSKTTRRPKKSSASPRSGGMIVSQGHNLSDDGSCVLEETGDQTEITAPLVSMNLVTSGGFMPTHEPMNNSPALNLITEKFCTDHEGKLIRKDQRGNDRAAGSPGQEHFLCDAGAVEKSLLNYPLRNLLTAQ